MPEFRKKAKIDATAIRETEKAVLCDVGGEKPVWIPQSQIDDDSEVWKAGDAGILIVNEWFAVEKGLV
jgi:hypothetical protein